MDLNWDSVFSWSDEKGHLVYVVYVGSEVGSANVITGMQVYMLANGYR